MRNNPRGFTPSLSGSPDSHSGRLAAAFDSVRRGVRPGEGAQREVIAYLLDHGGRAGVPPTAAVRMTFPDGSSKPGSLQKFVASQMDCEEIGYSALTVAQVRRDSDRI